MVHSHLRGHQIELWKDGWHYSDTEELSDYDRPCIRCGRMPTEEGYDACIGYVLGALSICCGHGTTEPIDKRIDQCLT